MKERKRTQDVREKPANQENNDKKKEDSHATSHHRHKGYIFFNKFVIINIVKWKKNCLRII